MSSIVNPVSVRMVCSVFPCREKANYMIGEPNRKQTNFYVCEKHLKQILDGASELFNPTTAKDPVVDPIVEAEVTDDIVVPFTDEVAPTEAPRPQDGTYACKHCGDQFPRSSDGKIELMKHSKVCPNKPSK